MLCIKNLFVFNSPLIIRSTEIQTVLQYKNLMQQPRKTSVAVQIIKIRDQTTVSQSLFHHQMAEGGVQSVILRSYAL